MLMKLLFNANTSDKITCLKDLQSNNEGEIGCLLRWSFIMKYIFLLIFTYRLTAGTQGCTDTLFLCENTEPPNQRRVWKGPL